MVYIYTIHQITESKKGKTYYDIMRPYYIYIYIMFYTRRFFSNEITTKFCFLLTLTNPKACTTESSAILTLTGGYLTKLSNPNG